MAGGDYGRIRGSFWTDPDIKRALNTEQKALLLYYFTSPHKNLIGLYYCPFAYAASETGIPEATVREWTLGPLSRFLTYDETTEEVFVHGSGRHQVGEELKEKDNQRKAVEKALEAVHSTALTRSFLTRYADWKLDFKAPEPQGGPQGPSEPLGDPPRSHSISEALAEARAPAVSEQNQITAAAHAHAREPDPPEPQPPAAAATAEELRSIASAWAEAHLKAPEKRRTLEATVETFVDLDLRVWEGDDGELAPASERPRLLRLALARIAKRQHPDLRQAVRYVVRQQLGPPLPRTNGNGSHPPEPNGRGHQYPTERPVNQLTAAETRAQLQKRETRAEQHERAVAAWKERREKAWKGLTKRQQKDYRDGAGKTLGPVLRRASEEKREQTIMHAVFVAMGQEAEDPYPKEGP